MSVKVLVADDHEIVRTGLQSVFAISKEIELVAEASNGLEAIELAVQHEPDVVLLDIRMPKLDGFQVINEIRTVLPETKFIILSTYDNPTYINRASELGAKDYLLKGTSNNEIIKKITNGKQTGGKNLGGDTIMSNARTMSNKTAEKLLGIVYNLEEMIKDIGAKQRILKNKIENCKSQADEELIKDATLVLGTEMDNINETITLVEDLHEHLDGNTTCVCPDCDCECVC